MIGLPITTGEINHYLNGGMDYMGGFSPYTYGSNLSIPKLNTLSVDAFSSTAKQIDKRENSWKYMCLYLTGVAAAAFGAVKCGKKSLEFVKDTTCLVGNGICSPFRWIGNKLKKK